MRLENMQNEFPGMPEEMRAMVEREVQKQLRMEQPTEFRRRKGGMKKALIAAMAAVMVLGTTVAAGAAYYLHSEPVGDYGVLIKTESNEADGQNPGLPLEIQPVNMEVSYLPEGMAPSETGDDYGKYCYADNMYQGGVSIVLYRMDTGDDSFEMSFTDVVSNEEIKVNGHDGEYLEFARLYEDEISFNQRIYVAYTDVHYVMEMFVASDVTKEEAIRIAEGIQLVPAGDGQGAPNISGWSWSEYQASLSEAAEQTDFFSSPAVSREKMQETHAIGEAFSLNDSNTPGLNVKVAEVQVLNNIGVLDLAQLDADDREELAGATDESGNLLPAEINYIRSGNGIDTVSDIVNTRQVPQKLVYVTVEYTNTGDSELTDVLFSGDLMKIVEDGNQVKLYSGEAAGTDGTWDLAELKGPCSNVELYYYDVHGGERGNNYIASIKPGETVTVHMGWLVPEEELGYLYLNLSPWGGAYEFDDTSLAIGYVDIRQ